MPTFYLVYKGPKPQARKKTLSELANPTAEEALVSKSVTQRLVISVPDNPDGDLTISLASPPLHEGEKLQKQQINTLLIRQVIRQGAGCFGCIPKISFAERPNQTGEDGEAAPQVTGRAVFDLWRDGKGKTVSIPLSQLQSQNENNTNAHTTTSNLTQ